MDNDQTVFQGSSVRNTPAEQALNVPPGSIAEQILNEPTTTQGPVSQELGSVQEPVNTPPLPPSVT